MDNQGTKQSLWQDEIYTYTREKKDGRKCKTAVYIKKLVVTFSKTLQMWHGNKIAEWQNCEDATFAEEYAYDKDAAEL